MGEKEGGKKVTNRRNPSGQELSKEGGDGGNNDPRRKHAGSLRAKGSRGGPWDFSRRRCGRKNVPPELKKPGKRYG